jgi:hypothetical protein
MRICASKVLLQHRNRYPHKFLDRHSSHALAKLHIPLTRAKSLPSIFTRNVCSKTYMLWTPPCASSRHFKIFRAPSKSTTGRPQTKDNATQVQLIYISRTSHAMVCYHLIKPAFIPFSTASACKRQVAVRSHLLYK